MAVSMIMGMRMRVCMLVRMSRPSMTVFMAVRVMMLVLVRQMDIELHARDAGFVLARSVEVVAVELELGEFALQRGGVHAEVEQRADEHITTDAGESVEEQSFHKRGNL